VSRATGNLKEAVGKALVCTGATRRRTQRTALGSVIGSRRRASAAASTLRACSTVATTCSISASVPGKRAAK
jgi:hypothetical protein